MSFSAKTSKLTQHPLNRVRFHEDLYCPRHILDRYNYFHRRSASNAAPAEEQTWRTVVDPLFGKLDNTSCAVHANPLLGKTPSHSHLAIRAGWAHAANARVVANAIPRVLAGVLTHAVVDVLHTNNIYIYIYIQVGHKDSNEHAAHLLVMRSRQWCFPIPSGIQ